MVKSIGLRFSAITLLGCWWALGCHADPVQTSVQKPALDRYCAPLGLFLTLPERWTLETTDQACIASSTRKGPSYFTPVTLQGMGSAPSLEEALETAYQQVSLLPDFDLEIIGPIVIPAGAGLLYRVSFVLHEAPRIRFGIILPHGAHLLDISRISNTELLGQNLEALEDIARSISFNKEG